MEWVSSICGIFFFYDSRGGKIYHKKLFREKNIPLVKKYTYVGVQKLRKCLGGFGQTLANGLKRGKALIKKRGPRGVGVGVEINEKNTYVILERLLWIKNIPQLTKRSE